MRRCFKFLGMIGILLPISIKAGSVSLSCNDTSVTSGGSTTCTLSGFSSEEVSGISAQLSSSGGVSISNISILSDWQGDGEDGNIELYIEDNKSGGFGIATFTVNVNGEGSISVGDVSFSDADFNDNGVSGAVVNIGVKENVVEPEISNNQSNHGNDSSSEEKDDKKSNDASLKELSLSNGVLDFNPDILNYSVEVSHDVEKISISAVANDSNANVSIPSDLSLKDGDNQFKVSVTAYDGTKKEYIINVKRLDKVLSTDSSLKSLSIEGIDIDFNSSKYIYDIGEVNSSSLNIDAVANDSNAVVRIYGSESIGKDDSIVIEVEAEDKSKTEYIIYVSNVSKKTNSTSKIANLVIWILLLISAGFNCLLIYKNRKK